MAFTQAIYGIVFLLSPRRPFILSVFERFEACECACVLDLLENVPTQSYFASPLVTENKSFITLTPEAFGDLAAEEQHHQEHRLGRRLDDCVSGFCYQPEPLFSSQGTGTRQTHF